MTIKDAEEADLWPLNFQVRFILGFQNVQDDADSVFVVVANNALVSVGSVRLDDATLLLTCLRGLMILQLNRFRVQWRWIFSKEKSLHFDKLDVGVFWFLIRNIRIGNVKLRRRVGI